MRWIERHLSDMDLYIIAGVCDKQKKKYEEEIQDMQDKLEEYGINKDIFKAIENDDLKYSILQGIFNIKQDECTYKEKYEKLQKKHRKASQMIAELKNNKGNYEETAYAISILIFNLMRNAGFHPKELYFEDKGTYSVISALNCNHTVLLKIEVNLPLNFKKTLRFSINNKRYNNAYVVEGIKESKIPDKLNKFNPELYYHMDYSNYNYGSFKNELDSIEQFELSDNALISVNGKKSIVNPSLLKQGMLFNPTNNMIRFKLTKNDSPLFFIYNNNMFRVYGVVAPKSAHNAGIQQLSMIDIERF